MFKTNGKNKDEFWTYWSFLVAAVNFHVRCISVSTLPASFRLSADWRHFSSSCERLTGRLTSSSSTCTLRRICRQLCRHFSEQSRDAGLVGLTSLSHIRRVSSQTMFVCFTAHRFSLHYMNCDIQLTSKLTIAHFVFPLFSPSCTHLTPCLPHPFYLGQSLM